MTKLLALALLLFSSCGVTLHTGSSHYNGLELYPLDTQEHVYPVLGAARIRSDNNYVYAGVQYYDILNDWLTYVVTVGAGDYEAGSLDLGYDLEFRTAFELFLGPHVGLGWVHLSNAGLGEFNPGFDAFMVTVRL